MAETVAVVDMLDTIGATAGEIPAGTRKVAIYLTGSGGIAWTNADVALLVKNDPQLQTVLRIDQSNSLLSLPVYLVKDIEPGASTIATAIEEAAKRRVAVLRTCFYFSRADWTAVTTAVAAAGLAGWVDFWVADWNLDRAGAISFMLSDERIKAVQWASPSSNPRTPVPGSNRTLSQANIDLSVTRAGWPTDPPASPTKKPPIKLPKPKLPKPHPKVTAAGISGALTTALLAYLNSKGAHLTHLTGPETDAISLVAAVIAGYFTPSRGG
jgi:hypothetical protein